MKRTWIGVVLILALMLPILSSAAQASGGVLLALGDSITTGYGLADDAEQCRSLSFAARAAEELGLAWDNRAVNGADTADLRALVEGGTIDDAVESAAAISITIGGNDLANLLLERVSAGLGESVWEAQTRLMGGDAQAIQVAAAILLNFIRPENNADRQALQSALERCRENLSAAVAALRAKNPWAPVVVATQYHPYRWMEEGLFLQLAREAGLCVQRLNEVIRSMDGIWIADAYSAFDASAERLCNASLSPLNLDFHPNDAGHQVLAEQLVAVLRPFSDVAFDAWCAGEVRFVSARGWMNGRTDGTFGPGDAVTRAQMAVVLWRMSGAPAPRNGAALSDLPAWCAGAVSWAMEQGIVTGYEDGSFRPDQSLTREQLSAMLYRWKGGPEFRGNLSGFPDGEAASPYAVPALGWAVEEGILRGDKQGMLRPGDMVRRDQLAVILFRCAQTHAVL
ncbi:S-layer homology domain-containing protein [Oscillibacter hominis]|uniref:S-layer homology domain-containing protein n=1 Tax=Oscillibacter hominis TaxID=2763056 RepID=A0A7G9B539_9FIRM|nr:S-layer homology domain-containing protein [Oscillibacter hominis]QNL44670.1 S-layer homology domain-containing protein [Oscillibacter hominis]